MAVIDTALKETSKEPWEFAGLLILVGLGVVINPFRIIIDFFSTYPPIFTEGTWDSITSMNSLNYDPYWGTLITIEIIANLVFIYLTLFLLFLFFKKKSTFPKWYFICALATVLFTLINSYLVSWIYPSLALWSEDTIKHIAGGVVSIFIWTPYLFISERAKNTFIQ